MFKSPLNYMWWKFPMLSFLKEHMPNKINTFVDLFWWWFNVWANIEADHIIYNDYNFIVTNLLSAFYQSNLRYLLSKIFYYMNKYNLINWVNEEWFKKLRNDYNNLYKNVRSEKCNIEQSILLYLLIVFGFNHQLRFNSKLEFNNAIWKTYFNDTIKNHFISFINNIHNKNISFYSQDYEELFSQFHKDTFVYIDPPYLITTWSYNDWKRWFNWWNEKEEIRLLQFIEKLNHHWIKFMLSNVFEHKWKINNLLIKFCKDNNLKVIYYEKMKKRKEVIIINY